MIQILNDSSYLKFRKSLLVSKGSDLQREFLGSMHKREDFLNFITSNVEKDAGDEIPLLTHVYSEREIRNFPISVEKKIYEFYKAYPFSTTVRTGFWGMLTVALVKEEKLDPSFFAHNGDGDGRRRLYNVCHNGDDKSIDRCVRDVLRRMGGLPEVRGTRSVMSNCTFGRAWWRGYYAADISGRYSDISYEDVASVFRASAEYWERFVNLLTSRNSILGDSLTRDVLIRVLAAISDKENDVIFHVASLSLICDFIGTRSVWQELSVLPERDLREIIEKEIERVRRQRQTP